MRCSHLHLYVKLVQEMGAQVLLPIGRAHWHALLNGSRSLKLKVSVMLLQQHKLDNTMKRGRATVIQSVRVHEYRCRHIKSLLYF